MIYVVRLRKDEEGVAVWVPGLPGCWSQGSTEQEALANIKGAIRDYLLSIEEEQEAGTESRRVEVELNVA